MKKILVMVAVVVSSFTFVGCDSYDPKDTEEYVQFQECSKIGGSYASEDTSAGRKWTCTVDGKQAQIQDYN